MKYGTKEKVNALFGIKKKKSFQINGGMISFLNELILKFLFGYLLEMKRKLKILPIVFLNM